MMAYCLSLNLSGTAGISNFSLWECAFAGLLCGQTRRRSNRSASHWCHGQLCHAYTGASFGYILAAPSHSTSHCLIAIGGVCLFHSPIRALLQIWMANLMPSVAFLPLTALMASAGVVNACKFCGALNTSFGQNVWRSWQDFLGLLGIAMLPQVALCLQDCAPSNMFIWISLAFAQAWNPCNATKHHTLLQHNCKRSPARCCRACSAVLLTAATRPMLIP